MSTVEQEEMSLLQGRISRLEAEVEFLYKHLRITFSENADSDDPRIIDALGRGNMIEAIKLYREQTKTGLADAKAAVEEIRARRGI